MVSCVLATSQPLRPSPHPSAGPQHMLSLLPMIPSLNLPDLANSYLYFKTVCLSLPCTETMQPGGGAGPEERSPLSSAASQAAGAAAVEPASWPQPGVIHSEWRDSRAWLLPCVK